MCVCSPSFFTYIYIYMPFILFLSVRYFPNCLLLDSSFRSAMCHSGIFQLYHSLYTQNFHFLSIFISSENNMMNKVFYELVRKAPSGRWNGIQRTYGPDLVHRLRSGVEIEYTLAVSILGKFFQSFVKLDRGLNMLFSSTAPNIK